MEPVPPPPDEKRLSYSTLLKFQMLTKALDPTELATIQATYRLIVQNFEEYFKRLFDLTTDKIVLREARNLEFYLIANLSSLKSLAVAKNSIIVLRGLNPSLFSLLFHTLPLQEDWFTVYYPNCFFVLISLAKTFAETHNQFVAHSYLFTCSGTKSSFLIEAPTAKFFSHILIVVTALLQNSVLMLAESESVLFQWLKEICESFECLPKEVEGCEEVVTLQSILLELFINGKCSTNSESSKILFQAIQHFNAFKLFSNKKFTVTLTKLLFQAANKLNNDEFYEIWKQIPSIVLISPILSKLSNTVYFDEQSVLGSSTMAVFQFEMLVNFFVDKLPSNLFFQKNECTWIFDWAERFCTEIKLGCKLEKRKSEKAVMTFFAMWRLIANHFALFCVENRLKTPIGKAVQTFLKFESVVRELVTEISTSKKNESDEESRLSRSEESLRIHFYLEMVDALDKLMVFAARGSMFNIAEISLGSRQFFQTNEFSCQGWMIRIAPPLMPVCFAAGNFSQIVRLVSNVFCDVERKFLAEPNEKRLKLDSSITLLICWIVRALIELSAPQAIKGVQFWVKKIFHVKMNWITYAESLASGNFETALEGFSKILKEEKLNDIVTKAIQEMCVKAICSLRNSNFSKPYFEAILKENDGEKNGNNEFKRHQMRRLTSFASWDSLDIVETKCGIQSELKEFSWNFQNCLENIEANLLRLWTDHCLSNVYSKSDARLQLQSVDVELSEISRLIMAIKCDEAFAMQAKVGLLKTTSLLIREQCNINFNMIQNGTNENRNTLIHDSSQENFDIVSISKFWKVGNVMQRLELGQMMCSWLSQLVLNNTENNKFLQDYGSKKFTEMQRLLVSAHAELAHLADKTGNVNLSQLHLQKYYNTMSVLNSKCDSQIKSAIDYSNLIDIDSNQAIWSQKFCTVNETIFKSSSTNLFAYKYSSELADEEQTKKTLPVFSNNISSVADTIANLKRFLRTEKMTWNLLCSNSEDEKLQLEARNTVFRNMIEVLCTRSFSAPQKDSKYEELVSKIFVCLGDWSRVLPSSMNILFQMQTSNPHSLIQKILHCTDYVETHYIGIDSVSALQGSFFMVAESVAPKSINSYKALSDWAMKQLFIAADDSHSIALNKEGTNDILRILPNEFAIFKNIGLGLEDAEGQIFLKLLGKCTSIDKLRAISTFSISKEKLPSYINALDSQSFTELWAAIKLRQFKLFEIAVKSSIQVLEHLSTTSLGSNLYKGSIMTISMSLRILNMLLTQPDWFDKTMETNWIVRVNGDIWKDIIPQLFACLNHRSDFVRKTIQRILQRVGEKSPHAICYPAIVNCDFFVSSSILKDLTQENLINEENASNNCETINEGEDGTCCESLNRNHDHKDRTLMRESCRSLVEFLRKSFPQMINDIVSFCREMQKINLLFEEKWLFVLTNLDNMVLRQFHQLDETLQKLIALKVPNADRKLNTVNKNIDDVSKLMLQILRDLYASTSFLSETINEQQFSSMYKLQISNAIEHFSENRRSLRKAWQPFKNLMEVMSSRAMKRSALYLHTHEISPYLSSLSSSSIPIPGHELRSLSSSFSAYFSSDSNEIPSIVTISKMHKTCYVLPTKTRPKKITFTGSDGKYYTFLFKGHEDLHLDERVMQLLRICNIILNNKNSKSFFNVLNSEYLYSVYSVTPLGLRLGLIEWVEGATPLFQIYRKWKIREMEDSENKRIQEKTKSAEACAIGGDSNIKNCNRRKNETTKLKTRREDSEKLEPERPTELFFSKLKAVFAEENVSENFLRNRQRWPISCLEKVYHELVKCTPRDILAKELWMKSGSSSKWWRVIEQFSRSAAITSAIGSIIGLGDRHLDNVLVDLSAGQVVHVDYNVCFEKGKNLRVPETVPFRLTGNIVHALGPTQIEGTFRESCIHVMSILRSNSKIFLSMLDAFVYDPLVDWSAPEQLNGFSLALLFAVYGCDNRSSFSLPSFPDNNNDRQKQDLTPLSEAASNLIEYENGYVKAISRRIQKKLSGYEIINRPLKSSKNQSFEKDSLDVAETSSMSPPEQVDFLIKQATNVTNLALLYEGWTSWV